MNNLDVHDLSLDAAIKVINRNIEICYLNGTSVLYVCHGFNLGHKIKTWCLKEAIKNKYVIKVECGDNEGISKIFIKTKFF